MLRTILLSVTLAISLAVPVDAQFNVSPRAGTIGVGGEVGLTLGGSIGVRAGYGVVPVSYETQYGGLIYKVSPSSPVMNVGINYFPGLGRLRFGGGLIFVTRPSEIETEQAGTFEIGGQTYVGDARITGNFDHGSMAPYVIIGFGTPSGSGLGPFLDVGAAAFGRPDLTLSATGTATLQPGFGQSLAREAREAEQDGSAYLRILPIFSLGFRFGL